MEIFNKLYELFEKLLKWWVMIMPWEQGIRVRFGNKVTILNSGIYLKIPFFDEIFIQEIRTRVIDLAIMTMETKDKKIITIKALLKYQIYDIYKLYNKISHVEMTIGGIAMACTSTIINNLKKEDIIIKSIEEEVNLFLKNEDFGINEIELSILSIIEPKTFRLIRDDTYMSEGLSLNKIK